MKTQWHSLYAEATLFLTLLTLNGCVINIGGCPGKARYEKVVALSHTATPGGHFQATTSSGSIQVTGTETTTCQVKATIRTRATTEEKAQELAEQINISLTPTANGLLLEAERPKPPHHCSIAISYQITTPHATHVTCKTSSGNANLNHLIGNTLVKVSSGSVTLQDLSQGNVDGRSSSGNVTLTQGTDLGTCTLHTSSGSIRAEHISAQSFDMHTSSGNVTAQQVTCNTIRAHTSSGSVKVTLTPETPGSIDANLSTSSGNASVTLPPTFAGHVELGSNSGSIRTNLPITIQGKISNRQIVGTVGTGTGRLNAKTSSGSVSVN